MSDVYKIQYNGMTLAYPGWNGYVGYENVPAFKTLTLCASEGGTVTASVLTGLPGDTVTLTPTYNTYYRFNNYSVTGGTIAGNTFTFGDENATAQANFKVNYFTATGGFEKGSNVTAQGLAGVYEGDATVPAKYAIYGSHTGDIPSTWWNTSNRWKITSDISAYSITLNPKMYFSTNGAARGSRYYLTACSLLGSTQTQSQSTSRAGNGSLSYDKTFTSNSTGINYGISAHIHTWADRAGSSTAQRVSRIIYVATGTTGTWTATGIAP